MTAHLLLKSITIRLDCAVTTLGSLAAKKTASLQQHQQSRNGVANMDAIVKPVADVVAGSENSQATRKLELADKKICLPREKLRSFINERCIRRVPCTSKEMPSIVRGEFYWWQFYLREAVLVPQHLVFIAEQFWEIYVPRFREKPFQLAGVEQASVPILTALLLVGANKGLPVHAFTIRKEHKAYGIGNIIEGRPINLPVVFIDDLTSPEHNTFWHATRVLARAGLKFCPWAFVLVRKQKASEPHQIATSIGTVLIDSIFTLDDFQMTYEDYQAARALR